MARTLRLPLACALVLLGTLTTGCGEEPVSTPRLTGGAESLEELGEAVWTAIVAGDTAALDRLRLTEYEHNELVWPEQPAAMEPSAAASLDLWWNNIQLRNQRAVRDLVSRYRDSDRTLTGVACPEEPRRYETYRALAGCRLLLEGPAGVEQVEAFRYVIRMDGRHKVVRYYGDE